MDCFNSTGTQQNRPPRYRVAWKKIRHVSRLRFSSPWKTFRHDGCDFPQVPIALSAFRAASNRRESSECFFYHDTGAKTRSRARGHNYNVYLDPWSTRDRWRSEASRAMDWLATISERQMSLVSQAEECQVLVVPNSSATRLFVITENLSAHRRSHRPSDIIKQHLIMFLAPRPPMSERP